MNISDQLRCLFSASVESNDGSYVIEIPKQELDLDNIVEGETYRVAVLSGPETGSESPRSREKQPAPEPVSDTEDDRPDPPVDEGEMRTVEIEDIGSQGDGITRVERGYVIIVPDTERSERVRIEITDVQENVAFAKVVERLSYYE